MQKNILFILLVFLFPINGAIITILTKYLDLEKTDDDIPFSHFWFLNVLMFLSEMLAIPLYYIIAYIQKKCQKNSEEQIEIYKSIPEKKNFFINHTLHFRYNCKFNIKYWSFLSPWRRLYNAKRIDNYYCNNSYIKIHPEK